MNRDFMPKDKRLLPTEGEEQARLFSWCRMHEWEWPELALLFHIPNGGSRKKSEAGQARCRERLSQRMSDYYTRNPEEWGKI